MGRIRRPEQDDRDELVTWLADGYAAAYRTAYLILHDPHDAEEAVQDAFLRAWRFRAAVPAGDGIRPWMYRVVVNSCISKLRSDRTRRERGIAFDGMPEEPAARSGPGADPETTSEQVETRDVLVAAIADLPEHLRVVVVLRYYGQLSEREIASAIHRRPGTVKSRLHDAKVRLAADDRVARVHAVPLAASGGMNA